MRAERRNRARSIFLQVVDLAASDRAGALDGLCGSDHALRAEVESLLGSVERAERFFSGPAAGAASAHESDAHPGGAGAVRGVIGEGPGDRIGPYLILERIGEGGFGSVFLAHQEHPVSRVVALKIVKQGMDTRQVAARFEQERQALALMDHPGIARVLDAGATVTGRPYFVMDVVRGEPITEFCDVNTLTVPERLNLFIQVCGAVQHAHSKGIIHRDIKPSNILVTTQNGHPTAKVIDFGIAKATHGAPTPGADLTEHLSVLGTPEYMSPEQAVGSADIDTRSDIYSLGAVLYELLAGAPPFSRHRLRSSSHAEMVRTIAEVDPPRPSERVLTGDVDAALVARRRGADEARVTALIRGDLDWIVLRALEKDRARRYETPNALAMDLVRHMRGEEVGAAPPSARYRLTKFVGRNRASVVAASLVVGALALGLTGVTVGLRSALTARDGESAAKLLAQDEARRAREAEAQTEARARDLRRVVDFQGGMLAQMDPARGGERLTRSVSRRLDAALSRASVPEAERRARVEVFLSEWRLANATDIAREFMDETMLRPAAEAIERDFRAQPLVEARLREVLAKLYGVAGLRERAIELQSAVLATRRRDPGSDPLDLVTSLHEMGALLAMTGDFARAEPYLREALEMSRRERGPDHRETLALADFTAAILGGQGQPEESQRVAAEAREARRRSQHEELSAAMGALQDVRASEGADLPRLIEALAKVGRLLSEQDRDREAEAYFSEALAVSRRAYGDEDERTIAMIDSLAFTVSEQGMHERAEPLWREAVERARRVLGPAHTTTLAMTDALVSNLTRRGLRAEAAPYYAEALAGRRKTLGDDHPRTLEYVHGMGTLLMEVGRFAESERLLREAYETGQRVGGVPGSLARLRADSLARLYSAWHQAEPGRGHDAMAQQWRRVWEDLR